ncbi:PLP-dependent aminotransferase family protein [Nocardioides sp. BGMRC 2183]|nr:PLP-dependent aminotransferase family protein [Nocardioides sp. BGMRC 2183]
MDEDSSWQTVADQLAAELTALPPGARIPSQRELVARFNVSATTVARAVATLRRRGLVESRPGAGSFRTAASGAAGPPAASIDTGWQDAALGFSPTVGHDPTPVREHDAAALGAMTARPTADVVDLNGGYLHPDLQPRAQLGAALSRVARSKEGWAQPDRVGLPDLRDWFATEIGGGLTRHDVLITAGGQAALSVALRAIGRPGDPVVVETPTYPGTLAAAHGAGLRTIPVPVDGDGLQVDRVDRVLAQTGARLVVVQPLYQNPTGATLAGERRRRLVEVVVRHGAFLVEDDFARYLDHGDPTAAPEPLATIDPAGAVLHIRSLTKPTSPNLRVAALAARGPVMQRLRATHTVDTMFVPTLLQRTALEVVEGPGWTRARRELAAALTQRRRTILDALGEYLPDLAADTRIAPGGYHAWLPLPPGVIDADAVAAALRAGVAVTPGRNYHAVGGTTGQLRLSYVAAASAADLVTGVRRLAGALAADPRSR